VAWGGSGWWWCGTPTPCLSICFFSSFPTSRSKYVPGGGGADHLLAQAKGNITSWKKTSVDHSSLTLNLLDLRRRQLQWRSGGLPDAVFCVINENRCGDYGDGKVGLVVRGGGAALVSRREWERAKRRRRPGSVGWLPQLITGMWLMMIDTWLIAVRSRWVFEPSDNSNYEGIEICSVVFFRLDMVWNSIFGTREEASKDWFDTIDR
jgi:hypothetical protein